MFTHVGGDGDNFNPTCLNTVAPTSITQGSAPFNGSYRPMGDLGIMNNGQNPNGNWQLVIRDTYPFADQGFLIGWGVIFGNNPAIPFPFYSSNLPIVKINTGGIIIPNEPKIPADFVIINHGNGIRNFVNDTLYEYKGKMLVEQQGYSGPYYPKKNYDFDLTDFSGNKIDTPLLGMPSENDWILKAEYLDATLMKNPLVYEIARRMGVYAPRTKYCEVTVNGEYMGVYSLTEKVKRDANRVDIAKLSKSDTSGAGLTGGYIFEMNINGSPPQWTSQYLPINYATNNLHVEFQMVYPKADSILPKQLNYIHAYTDSFENALMRDSVNPNEWRNFASEKSFIDFQVVNEFSVNYDTYGRSTYLYKDKNKKLHIGPPWDYDRAYFPGTENVWVWEITHQGWPFPFWWSKLNNDSVYLKKLWCRWNTLRETTLSDDSVMLFIDSTESILSEGAARNFLKWTELGVADYHSAVQTWRDFINVRLPWMDANIFPHGEFLPVVNLEDTSVCSGNLIGANAGNIFNYTWSTGDSVKYIPVLQSGNYSLTVTDDYGCSASDDADVIILPLPDASFSVNQNSTFNFTFIPSDTSFQNYFWNFGDGFSSSLKKPSYTFSSTGSFSVSLTVTDTNGCSSTDSTLVPIVLGLHETDTDFISVLPNPFADELEIKWMKKLPQQVQIFDITGKKVFEKTSASGVISISTVEWETGVYFLKTESGTKKLVKQH